MDLISHEKCVVWQKRPDGKLDFLCFSFSPPLALFFTLSFFYSMSYFASVLVLIGCVCSVRACGLESLIACKLYKNHIFVGRMRT